MKTIGYIITDKFGTHFMETYQVEQVIEALPGDLVSEFINRIQPAIYDTDSMTVQII